MRHPRIVISALPFLRVVRAAPAGARRGGAQPRTGRGIRYITGGADSGEHDFWARREFGKDSCV